MTDKLKEKLGDWLLDIAKYLMTAVALTSIFDGLGAPMTSIVALFISILLMALAVILFQTSNNNKEGDK